MIQHPADTAKLLLLERRYGFRVWCSQDDGAWILQEYTRPFREPTDAYALIPFLDHQVIGVVGFQRDTRGRLSRF